MNAIAFSLYGSDPRYLTGAVENARMAGEFYPGWQACFWVGTDVQLEHRGTVDGLMKHGALLYAPVVEIPNGMFWRFLVHDLPGVERYIVRDVDSRFTRREVKAVNEWIAAGTQLHVMRDHPLYHTPRIMAGMWGWQKQAVNDFDMAEVIGPHANKERFGQDQDFLAAEIWPRAASKTVHDVRINWPVSSPGFVGEYIDQHGRPNEAHRQARLEWFKEQRTNA